MTISPDTTPTNTSPQVRALQIWRGLPLSRKLLLAFGVLFVFSLLIAVATISGLTLMQRAYEKTLTQGVEARRLSNILLIDLLQARRAEKNFLLRWRDEGYDLAYENYITLYQENLSGLRDALGQLGAFADIAGNTPQSGLTREEYQELIASLNQNVNTYDLSFTNLIEALKVRGADENTGLEAELRNSASKLEKTLTDKEGASELLVTLLQIRRHEKDYLARGDQEYIDLTRDTLSQFQQQVTTSERLTASEKDELLATSKEYLANFDAIVTIDIEIAGHNEELIAAARAVEPLAEEINQLGTSLAALTTSEARRNATQTIGGSIFTTVAALVIAIFLSIALSRQLTDPVIRLTKVAEEIGAGNFASKAPVDTGDEIGTLAKTFNVMTARIEQAFEDIRRRALAVQTSAEISRRLSAASSPRQLAVDVVEQLQTAFNYYHAHIYFFDDQHEYLVMAGGTGEAGAKMLANGHKIQRGRGLVGRAAETSAPVLVEDVTQAIGWLPNPLLPETRSELAVPILLGSAVLGVIDVQQNKINGFGDNDEMLLQSIASQVAISLQNARNFEQTRSQAEFESLVNTISQKIQRATTIENTLQVAVREIGMALGATRVKAKIEANSAPEQASPDKMGV